MNQPTPAIIAQDAVRRLPRPALLLFCLAYVVPGFVGREPWKNADIAAFGYMYELAQGAASWLHPTLAGQPPEFDALLPYWLGAWAMRLAPGWIAPDFAVRIPFALLLALTLMATWYGVYLLARSPRAQPVPFAFGGEANPKDYARAMADGGLLALIACLGLAQLSHETTPALAQVAFTSLSFFAMAALPTRPRLAALCLLLGLGGLALSGAASMAMLFGAGAVAICSFDREGPGDASRTPLAVSAGILVAALLATAALSGWLDLWRWRISPDGLASDWASLGRLMLWFTWPAWPLALWTLWRWRRQLASRHVALPLWFVLVSAVTTWVTPSSDRSLLLGLPAMATLAAFALPTLSRSVAALIDWFTLLFFSGCALVIWVIWLSLQTGIPPKPAANVARLAPGFEPSFSFVAFAAALGGHRGLGLAGALAHRTASLGHLEKPGVAGGGRGPVLAVADDALVAGAGLRPQLHRGGEGRASRHGQARLHRGMGPDPQPDRRVARSRAARRAAAQQPGHLCVAAVAHGAVTRDGTGPGPARLAPGHPGPAPG